MTAKDPIFVVGPAGAGQTSPTEARLALAGLVAPSTGGVEARAGVLYGPGSPLAVTGTTGMSYSVSAGVAVATRATAALGAYIGSNDAAATVSTTAAPGTVGTSRYDLVYLRFPDAEQGDPNSAAVLGVVQGAAAASPTRPTGSVPAGALVLAEALVPNGTTRTDTGVTITQTAPYTAARGATLAVRSQTERDALTAYNGLRVYRIDTGREELRTGGAWKVVSAPGAWTPWTPSWTASGTNPTVGNSVFECAYSQVGQTVSVRISLTIGSTAAAGAGAYSLSLPVAAIDAVEQVIAGEYFDSSTGNYHRGTARLSGTLLGRARFVDGTTGPSGWTSGVPVVPAAGDVIMFTGIYEAA